MPSHYQPPVWNWKADLPKISTKGIEFDPNEISQLYYLGDSFCEINRENLSIRYNYLLLSFAILPVILYLPYYYSKDPFLTKLLLVACIYIIYNYGYPALFSPYNNPIRFNRKTGKVYINESIFFTFAPFRNLLYLLLPLKKRIQEYSWKDIHCVITSPKADYFNLVCIVCKPNTNKVIDSFKLSENIKNNTLIWEWLCNYMLNELSTIDSPPYKPSTFKFWNIIPFIIPPAKWPFWIKEASHAKSNEELNLIKKKYRIL